MSANYAKVASAVDELKNLVLADPELKELARQAKTPAELASLWSSPQFRTVHDRVLTGISTEDVKNYLDELKDEQLDSVTGGAVDAFLPANFTSPRDVYVTALQQALATSLYF